MTSQPLHKSLELQAGIYLYSHPVPSSQAELSINQQGLTEEESTVFKHWGFKRQASFVSGRVAAHQALHDAGYNSSQSILRSAQGAPLSEAGPRLSITHKNDWAIAACAHIDSHPQILSIGVDMEERQAKKHTQDIRSMVLSEREQSFYAEDWDSAAASLLAVFSIKEAIYKALAPFLQRMIGFHEVEIIHPTENMQKYCGTLLKNSILEDQILKNQHQSTDTLSLQIVCPALLDELSRSVGKSCTINVQLGVWKQYWLSLVVVR